MKEKEENQKNRPTTEEMEKRLVEATESIMNGEAADDLDEIFS